LLRDSGPLRAGDIAGKFRDMSRIAVSKHLRVLRDARLARVIDSDDGRERLYSLDADGLAEIREWLRGYEVYWRTKLDELKSMVEDDNED
jgi:DNA-binding transcriptional ArsR family regulator